MSDERPATAEKALAAIEEAIQHWVSLRMPRALLTGWVLHYATTSFDDEDGETMFQVRYCCGPQTDLVRAIGTSDLGHRTMLADVLDDTED